ncbi:type II secretion system F family protein [Spongisporangium articulatum]|uniref:Type II secretion system F family protein n=1 Tax=Spongisporangium articulatum TaxID=3362603 RepID=A0ABW8AIB2_9ACTN
MRRVAALALALTVLSVVTVPMAPGAEAAGSRAVVVLDTSGSMRHGRDLDAARAAAEVYAGAVGDDVAVGLVSFAATTSTVAPTTDREALGTALDGVAAGGRTALYDGLLAGVRAAGPGGDVVLLSDGQDTASHAGLEDALAAVADGGVHVDVVAFRPGSGSADPLRRIALAGGGRLVTARDAGELGAAFRVAAASAHRPPVVTLPAAGGAAPLGLAVLVGALAAIGVGLLLWPRRSSAAEQLDAALRAYGFGATPAAAGPQEEGSSSAVARRVLGLSERFLSRGDRRERSALALDRAGLTLLPREWLVLRACVLLAGAAVGAVLVPGRVLGLLLGAAAAFAVPVLWLRQRQSARCGAFADQLPDTLQIVASGLRSGFSLPQALASAQDGGLQPMAAELGRALSAARFGLELEDELEQVAMRMRSDDWRMAVMAVRIQRSVGGNLAEILLTTAATLRERAGVVRQVKALSAEGRLSAWVLMGLPVLVGAFLLMFRRDYLEPLWTTPVGVGLLLLSALMMAAGTTWMLKVARVEV